MEKDVRRSLIEKILKFRITQKSVVRWMFMVDNTLTSQCFVVKIWILKEFKLVNLFRYLKNKHNIHFSKLLIKKNWFCPVSFTCFFPPLHRLLSPPSDSIFHAPLAILHAAFFINLRRIKRSKVGFFLFSPSSQPKQMHDFTKKESQKSFVYGKAHVAKYFF